MIFFMKESVNKRTETQLSMEQHIWVSLVDLLGNAW